MLVPSNENQCFIFEEVCDGFETENRNGILEKMGKLNEMRIRKHVKKLHILMESINCGYIAKNAIGCHYECQFFEVLDYLERHPMPFIMKKTAIIQMSLFT